MTLEAKITQDNVKEFVKMLTDVSFSVNAVKLLQREAISFLDEMSLTKVNEVMAEVVRKAAKDTKQAKCKSVTEQVLSDAIDHAYEHRLSPKKVTDSPRRGRGPKRVQKV